MWSSTLVNQIAEPSNARARTSHQIPFGAFGES